MTSPFRSPNSPPAWGAAAPRGGPARAALALAVLLATYMAAWTFLAAAVAEPAARFSAGAAPRAAPVAADRLAAAEEGPLR